MHGEAKRSPRRHRTHLRGNLDTVALRSLGRSLDYPALGHLGLAYEQLAGVEEHRFPRGAAFVRGFDCLAYSHRSGRQDMEGGNNAGERAAGGSGRAAEMGEPGAAL